MRNLLRFLYLPTMLVGGGAAVLVLAASSGPRWILGVVLAAAVTVSTVVERLIPADPSGNTPRGDTARDVAHAAVNETLAAGGVAAVPMLTGWMTVVHLWPERWPFVVQVLVAIVVFDLGVTAGHMASHRLSTLWRFHAVHHSVTRLYGLNGLMKHPLHQTFEMVVGVAPLVFVGLPATVATALAGCAALQLLLQHSNADYRAGPLRGWLALNEAHRIHHLNRPGDGDVNFGLFTLIWDRLVGSYAPPGRPVTTDDLGVAGRPDYPVGYLAQLMEPFRTPPASLATGW